MALKKLNNAQQQLLDVTEALLNGNYSKRITIDASDTFEAKLANKLNRLADVLLINSSHKHSAEYNTIEEFIDVLSSYATGNFTRQLKVSTKNTVIDAIATGINILGEELEKTMISRDFYSKEYNNISELLQLNKKLTKRERQVMTLIAEELTNLQIANKLHISKRTVEGHRKNILKKLKLKNTAALTKYALKNGLV